MKPLSVLQYEKEKSSPTVKVLYLLEQAGLDLSFLVFGNTRSPNPNDFPPEVISAVAETLKQLEELFENEGGFSECEKIRVTLMLLHKMGGLRNQQAQPSLAELIKSSLLNMIRADA